MGRKSSRPQQLEGIHAIASTGDDHDVSYWNRYVGITQIGDMEPSSSRILALR
jgi:hypothetical protein